MRHTGEQSWGDARARREIRTLRVNVLGSLVSVRHVAASRSAPPLRLTAAHPTDPDVVADYLAELTTHVSGDVVQIGLADHAGSDHFDGVRLEATVCVDWNPSLVLDVRSGAVAVESAAADAAGAHPDVTTRVITGRVELSHVRRLHAETFTGDVRARTISDTAMLHAEHGRIRVGDALGACLAHTGALGRVEFVGTPPPRLDVEPGEGTVTCQTAQVGVVDLPAGRWAFTNDTLRWLGRLEDDAAPVPGSSSESAGPGMPHPRAVAARTRGLV